MADESREQSHRQEMSAAIRAQRERHAVPKTIAPEAAEGAVPPQEPARAKRRLGRFRRS